MTQNAIFKDYYKILGISEDANAQDIKSAYRSMSMKWHPDRNSGLDVTSIMQDINEAYAILKDPDKRSMYDKEYAIFQEQRHSHTVQSYNASASSSTWNYNYDVHDETLKEDIKAARQAAVELVNTFLESLGTASKNAIKGAWESAKWFVLWFGVISIVGLVIGICTHTYGVYNEEDVSNVEFMDVANQNACVLDTFQIPSSWTKYYIDNNSFSIAVPKTVELRKDYDAYTKWMKKRGLACNTDAVVFQQKGLSSNSRKAMRHYCRILIEHYVGNSGDFPQSYETEPIDEESQNAFHDLIIRQLGSYSLLNEPTYRWIDINGTKAIEMKYSRSGTENKTASCAIYLLFNDDEMVQMIVSYREQEKEMWLPDLDNVIKTFKWI